jgi:hypothetical protein
LIRTLPVVVGTVRDEDHARRSRVGGDGQGALQQDLTDEWMRIHRCAETKRRPAGNPVEVTQARGPRQLRLQPQDVPEVADDGTVGGNEQGNHRDLRDFPAFQTIDRRLDRARIGHPESDLGRPLPIEAARQLLDVRVPKAGGGMATMAGMGMGTVRQQQNARPAFLGPRQA